MTSGETGDDGVWETKSRSVRNTVCHVRITRATSEDCCGYDI